MDQRVETIITFIEDNFNRTLSVSDLAKYVNLSPWHLLHLFKAETGASPLQYIRAVRMAQAEWLLENTFLSVKQIMIQVGIRDESHFVRDFKSMYDLSPTRFRQRFSRAYPKPIDL
ncbi:MAG TPA: AraC family transcriptional regulator [Pyrinomonadaceae bacterium]|nr:AraC family transcriptional regulator [Pyrinomonadaceae bacterium]